MQVPPGPGACCRRPAMTIGRGWRWRRTGALRTLSGNDGSGRAFAYAVSRDRGLPGLSSRASTLKAGSSHMAIGPAGEIAVPDLTRFRLGKRVPPGGVLPSPSATTAARAGSTAPSPARVSGRSPTATTIRCHDGWSPSPGTAQDGSIRSDSQGCTWHGRAMAGATWTARQIAAGDDLRYFPYLVVFAGKGPAARIVYLEPGRVAHTRGAHRRERW